MDSSSPVHLTSSNQKDLVPRPKGFVLGEDKPKEGLLVNWAVVIFAGPGFPLLRKHNGASIREITTA